MILYETVILRFTYYVNTKQNTLNILIFNIYTRIRKALFLKFLTLK